MAEVGVIASALQIADLGVRISLRLYTFGETVASADKSIIAISEHLSLTSSVLKELGQTLDKDRTSRICSRNAVQTADSIVKQCQRIFQEMDNVLVKKFPNTKSTEKDRRVKAAQTLERLKWPFIKGKIDLLMSNLEKEKSTLVLMLNVITLAKQEHERTEPYTIIAEQRSLIEDLAKSNEGYIRQFERLKLSCEGTSIDQGSFPADRSSSIPIPKALTARGLLSTLAVDAPSQSESSADASGLDRKSYKGSDRPNFSSSDRLGWLQQQYSNLMRTLLREISAPHYGIAEDSRLRIKTDIARTQRREMDILSQRYYLNFASSRPMHREYLGSKNDVDQVSAPAQPVFRQHSNMRCDFRPQSYTGKANMRHQQVMVRPQALETEETPTLKVSYFKTSSFQQTRKRGSRSSSVQSETSLERPASQRGNDSVQPFSSQRSRIPVSAAFAGPVPRNNSVRMDHNGRSRAKEGRTLLRKESFNGFLKDDDIDDYAEQIVDKLLATWTTLPLHASQIDPRHGSLAEAAC